MLKKLVATPRFRRIAGSFIAGWFRLIRWTCRRVDEPEGYVGTLEGQRTIIVTTWHGEHFMLPFARPVGWEDWLVKAMISRSRDGELNAIVAEKLGVGTIRASGGRDGNEVRRRGGVAGFVAALRELSAGNSVMLTADVPKVGKIVGEGIIQIARHSGRPIIPVATVTSRRHRTDSWDRAAINLPFGRFAVVYGEPITVARDAGPEEVETARRALQDELNRIHVRAYEIVGGRDV